MTFGTSTPTISTPISLYLVMKTGFPGGSVVNKPPANARDVGDTGPIPEMGKFPGGGNGSPLQHSCLENPMDTGAWQAAVHGVKKEPDNRAHSTDENLSDFHSN